MTMTLMALYAQPADPEAFDRHYTEVHTPLVEKIPGLEALRVNKVRRKLMGDTELYQIAEIDFADKAAFGGAMSSAENQAAGADLAGFAKGIVTLLVVER